MKMKTYLLSGTILVLAVAALLVLEPGETITGFFSLIEVVPEGFEFEPPATVSEAEAQQAIQDAEVEIAEMKQLNFTTTFVKDVLHEANIQYEQGNYTAVLEMAELVSFISQKKVEFLDKVELVERKEREYQDNLVDTGESQPLVGQAQEAFYQDQLVDAQYLLQQADTALEKAKAEKERQKSLAYLSKNFLIRYWWEIILAAAGVSVITPPMVGLALRKKRRHKLAGLKEELQQARESIKRLQKECFVDKKIAANAYKVKAARYEERMAEIKHTIPVIEAQLQGKKGLPIKQKPPKLTGIIEVKR